jgi:hypothetical protein
MRSDILEDKVNHSVDVVTLPAARPDKLKIDMVLSIYEREG